VPQSIFEDIATVKYEGIDSTNALSYQFYDAEKIVMGKPLKDHLRFAVAYWHSFAMTGGDPFGGPTIHRKDES
jgi:xylose isomerase